MYVYKDLAVHVFCQVMLLNL